MIHADTGMLGLTTKHIYFAGPRKKFRVRYDRIVAFEPYSDGLGIMRDAQSAKPQSFVTGDGWFVYNQAATLPRCNSSSGILQVRPCCLPDPVGQEETEAWEKTERWRTLQGVREGSTADSLREGTTLCRSRF